MTRRIAASFSALVLSASFAGTAFASAGPKGTSGSTGATTVPVTIPAVAKGKLVSFRLRNDSGSALTLQIGDQQFTVAAGKTADIKAAQGAQIVAVNSAGHMTAGAVVTTVSQTLSGNTLAVN